MKFRRVKDDETSFISIAPLIDIVFLLLIFFMLTTKASSIAGLPVSLPETSADYRGEEIPTVTITIDGPGALFLEGALIERGSLTARLSELKSIKGSFHLLLEADKNVSHGLVVEIMGMAKQAGAGSIIIAAYPARPRER